MGITARRVLTLHAPLGKTIANAIIDDVERSLKEAGAIRWWISTDALPDLTLMAEIEDDD